MAKNIPVLIYLLSVEPEIVIKYVKLSSKLLRITKEKAQKKGKEHRAFLAKNELFGDFFC